MHTGKMLAIHGEQTKGKKSKMKKKLVIVGGANGVGKTTFAYQYKEEFGIDYLGADAIADEIKGKKDGNIDVLAGKEFFRRLDTYFVKNQSVIIESTLSGLGLAKQIMKFKDKGYLVHIVFVFLDDVELCKKRIQFRVKKGGHNVPADEIERRFTRSLRNFQQVYLPLSDTWQLFYNGLRRPIEVAVGEKGKTMIIDEEFYRIFQEISK
jgi:predicted ABC-type ATPase